MADLSPAARAIVRVFDDRYELAGLLEADWQEQCLAAALVALADQVTPEPVTPHDSCCDVMQARIRGEILAIAAELESANG